MHVQRLRIERVRNLKTVVLSQLQPFNIFYGQNASGKSSVLEALHLLATGKSFRTNLVKQYVQHGQSDAIIYAEAEQYRLGLQKQVSGEQLIRLNGDTVATQSELAKLLPIQLIDPESISIIDTGSKPRRQLLDWLMFHVEPGFYPFWLKYQRALKQRNNLLRSSYTKQAGLEQSLQSWESALAHYGEPIHLLREKTVDKWLPVFQSYCQQLLPDQQLTLSYVAGFESKEGLLANLIKHRQRDIEKAGTQYGPHRADLRLKTPLGGVEEVLSRGQKKLLLIALKLSQIHMLHDLGHQTVVLLDDFTAELDASAQRRLISALIQLQSQIFMTTLEYAAVVPLLNELDVTSYAVFHVAEGTVTPLNDAA